MSEIDPETRKEWDRLDDLAKARKREELIVSLNNDIEMRDRQIQAQREYASTLERQINVLKKMNSKTAIAYNQGWDDCLNQLTEKIDKAVSAAKNFKRRRVHLPKTEDDQ